MNTNDVIDILIFFRDIEKEIKFCRRVIDDFEERFYMVGQSANYDEPVVLTGATSDVAARLALNLPDSIAPSCRQLEDYIVELAGLKTEIFSELKKLSYIQKAVIYAFYVEQMKWARIAERESCSRETCNRHKRKGIKKLQGFFNGNAAIKNFFAKMKS